MNKISDDKKLPTCSSKPEDTNISEERSGRHQHFRNIMIDELNSQNNNLVTKRISNINNVSTERLVRKLEFSK